MVCIPCDPPCPSGSDLQSSQCTLGEDFEDLDWETEKGLEAVACDTEGFVPPKVMVRPGHPRTSPASLGRGSFLREPTSLCLGMRQPRWAAQWVGPRCPTRLCCWLPLGSEQLGSA